MNGLPTVRIDDILVHPRDNDLIVGTHGRSIYIIDDITPLQQLTEAVLAADAHAFDVRSNVLWISDTMMSRGVGGAKHFRGQNPPAGTAISYYLKSAPQGDVKITILDSSGRTVRELSGTKNAGINRVQWNFTAAPPQPAGGAAAGGGGGGGRGGFGGTAVEPGSYVARITIGDREFYRADPGRARHPQPLTGSGLFAGRAQTGRTLYFYISANGAAGALTTRGRSVEVARTSMRGR